MTVKACFQIVQGIWKAYGGTLAQVIPMMCICRAVQQEPITPEFSLALLDGVIIPALRGGARPGPPARTAHSAEKELA